MKSISTGLFVALLTFGLPSAHGQDAVSDLKKLDAKLTDAFKTRDFKMLAKHMADDYMLIDPRGKIHTKTQYFKHISEGAPKFEELKETDVKVAVHGDSGIVTGLLHVKGKFQDKMVNAEYRWTRVYQKKGEEWRCILETHTHVAPAMEAKKP